jgi:hypothetical protein
MPSKFFPTVDVEDLVDETPPHVQKPTVKPALEGPETALYTDKETLNVYKVPVSKVAPNADFSVEERSRELAMIREKAFEYNNVENEKREVILEPEDLSIQDNLRKLAMRDARNEINAMPSRDPALRDETEPEKPFNMRGLNEDTRRYDLEKRALRTGAENAPSRPLPTMTAPAPVAKTEHIYLPDDKNVAALKVIFRNLMGTPGSKVRATNDTSGKVELDALVRSVLDSGISKKWTPPDMIQTAAKPENVAYAVGRRALEGMSALKNMPEIRTLSSKERDELIMSVGRTMLNVAITGPAGAKNSSKITENAPMVNDSVRRTILATLNPTTVMQALGPELKNYAMREKAQTARVTVEAEARAKPTGNVGATLDVQQPAARVMHGAQSSGTTRSAPAEIRTEIHKSKAIWHDPYA